MLLYDILATDCLPEPLIRWGIRQMLGQKLNHWRSEAQKAGGPEALVKAFAAELSTMPIAIETKAANEQHYELPSGFFQHVLGPRLKYSGCLWEPGTTTLGQAEDAMLACYAERAQLRDGMHILDLGCGWGSFTLWAAEHYPNARITALSNSATQRTFIEAQCAARGFHNVRVVTANIATVDASTLPENPDHPWQFDRIVSVEMMEHMKNYGALFEKLAGWLAPEGEVFVHIFTHKDFAYHYDKGDSTDWLTRYFFTGGTMPAHRLFMQFPQHLRVAQDWAVNGTHYEKTANAWLDLMKARRAEIWPILEATYGKDQARRWWVYWKLFFLACAELWGYDHGREWQVSHYRLVRA